MITDNQADIGLSVGIFWGVPDAEELVLVTDRSPFAAAEPYGDFLTHPRGHYEVWEEWRLLGAAGLIKLGLPGSIASGEYEEFPRGRIVFDTQTETFIIYADRKLQTAAIIQQIVDTFGLAGQRTAVRSDAHYRS